jgi:hypothetical protein
LRLAQHEENVFAFLHVMIYKQDTSRSIVQLTFVHLYVFGGVHLTRVQNCISHFFLFPLTGDLIPLGITQWIKFQTPANIYIYMCVVDILWIGQPTSFPFNLSRSSSGPSIYYCSTPPKTYKCTKVNWTIDLEVSCL